MVKQIGKEFDRARQLLIQHLHVIGGRLTGSEGIHLSTERVDFARNVGGGAFARSLEEHVFDEVRIACLGRLLVPRPRIDPDSNGDGLERRHPFGYHAHPIIQDELAVQGSYLADVSGTAAPVGAGIASLRLSRIFPWRSTSRTFAKI